MSIPLEICPLVIIVEPQWPHCYIEPTIYTWSIVIIRIFFFEWGDNWHFLIVVIIVEYICYSVCVLVRVLKQWSISDSKQGSCIIQGPVDIDEISLSRYICTLNDII